MPQIINRFNGGVMQPKDKLIYVASPYTHTDPAIEDERNISVALATGYLMNHYAALAFFSPICHSHIIARNCNILGQWEYWKHLDEIMISKCDELWVLCLEGWEKSVGVTAEVKYAKELGLEIKYILPQIDGSYVVVAWVRNQYEDGN